MICRKFRRLYWMHRSALIATKSCSCKGLLDGREVAFKSTYMQLEGKVAVITGASMGIGEALAKLFVDEGALVVLSARDEKRIEEARARIGQLTGPSAYSVTSAIAKTSIAYLA